jgi:hypothetical protein
MITVVISSNKIIHQKIRGVYGCNHIVPSYGAVVDNYETSQDGNLAQQVIDNIPDGFRLCKLCFATIEGKAGIIWPL